MAKNFREHLQAVKEHSLPVYIQFRDVEEQSSRKYVKILFQNGKKNLRKNHNKKSIFQECTYPHLIAVNPRRPCRLTGLAPWGERKNAAHGVSGKYCPRPKTIRRTCFMRRGRSSMNTRAAVENFFPLALHSSERPGKYCCTPAGMMEKCIGCDYGFEAKHVSIDSFN